MQTNNPVAVKEPAKPMDRFKEQLVLQERTIRSLLPNKVSYEKFQAITGHFLVKIILLGLIWSFLHHFCAGIRYLVLDLHIGMDKESAAKSASMVLGVSLALTLVFGLKLFGVW